MKAMPDAATMLLLMKYHIFQGDRDIKHVKVIPLENGNELHLMRFVNEYGVKHSSLDMIMSGKGEDYATEMMSCPRWKEKAMLAEAREVFR